MAITNLKLYMLVLDVSYVSISSLILLSNFAVLGIFASQCRKLPTYNWYMLSSCVSDVLLALVVPMISVCFPAFRIDPVKYAPSEEGDGDTALCVKVKLGHCVLYMSMFNSIYTILAVLADRRRRTIFPIKSQTTQKQGFIISIIIWCLSLIYQVPSFIIEYKTRIVQVETPSGNFTGMVCHPAGSALQMYSVLSVLLSYILPIIITGILYNQVLTHLRYVTVVTDENRKEIRRISRSMQMILVLTLAYAICWATKHAATFDLAFKPVGHPPPVMSFNELVFLEMSPLLPLCYSWIKPIVYIIYDPVCFKIFKILNRKKSVNLQAT